MSVKSMKVGSVVEGIGMPSDRHLYQRYSNLWIRIEPPMRSGTHSGERRLWKGVCSVETMPKIDLYGMRRVLAREDLPSRCALKLFS